MLAARLTGVVFLLIFAAYGYLSDTIVLDFWAEEEVFNARTFPQMIAVGGMAVSLLFLLSTGPVSPGSSEETAGEEPRLRELNWRPVLILVALMTALAFSLEALGFIVAMTLFLVSGFVALGERRPGILLVSSLPLVLGLALILDMLGIHLEPGILQVFRD